MAGRRNYQIDRRRTKTTKQQEMDANNFGDDDDDENEFEQEEFDEDQQEDVNPFGNDEDDDEENQEDAPQEELEQVQETLGAEEKQDNTVNEQEVEEQPAGDEDVEEEEEVSSINKEDSGEDYKEDSSVTEEEEEDEYEPEETTAAKRGRKRPPAAPVRASARAKRSSYGDDDDDDDDSDSDFGQPKRRARCNAGAKKKKYQEDSEEEQEFESEHSEEPSPPHNEKRRDRPPKAAAKAKALPRGRPAKRKVVKRKEDDDSEEEEEEFDEEEDDSDDSEFGKPRPKKNNKRNTRRSNRNGMTGSSEEDEEEFSNPQTRLSAASRRSTPSRFSAALASQRLTDFPSEEEEQDEEVKPKPKPRNGKGSMSSDEEFLADSESEASDEKANNSESYDDDSSVHDNTPATATAQVGDVDDNEVGTADESSDEEEFMDTPVAKKKVSPMDEITPRRSSQGDDDDSSGSEAFVAEMRQRNSRPKLPVCPSIEDAITAETLPKRHVCYISPDGSSRQCFALETLRLIALKNTTRTFRVDLTGDQQTFLQPPHFRTSMSDDLLDQIASRFGREALELDGEFYRRKPIALNDDDDEQDGIFVPHHSLLRDHEAFMDHLERYIERQMGHQDIYTCPLCYSEMHRRIVAKQDDESDEERENEASDSPVESVYDPMLVLGYVDDDTFEAASAFCFTKVAKLKVHIREDHRVDTKGIQGNDMYARYKIRAPDGLLQRWLNNTNRFGTFQGDMRRYWNEGNNQNFVYLLQLMQRAEIYREILQDEDDEDRDVAEGYLLVARTFFESFANRVRHDWERLASPFFKSKGEDLKGFLVDDEDEEDEIPHFIAQRELAGQGEETSDANDLVSKIQRKYAEHEDDSEGDVSEEADDDENAEDEDGEDDSDANVEVPNGYYSEVEEEEDDWVKDIKSKRKSKSSPKNVNGSATKRVGKKLTKRKSTPSPSSAKLEPEPSSSASKKLVILEDSEDE
jgi:hypothetical protein